ncbi:hypothetical protein ES703_97123 [subsurface metagenome]
MITEAITRLIKHPPEKIPDSWFGNVPALAEVAPPILDLRRFSPYVLTLADIQLPPDPQVIMRARYNGVRVEENTAALLRDNVAPPNENALVGAWSLVAKEFLYYNFLGIAGAAPYYTHFGVWGIIPTVADKLAYDITLSNEEKELAERLGIANSVEKGVLPLPRDVQISREYLVIGEETHSRNITVSATVATIENIYARENEFLVLTRMAAQPGGVADDIRFIVDRDDDHNYANVKTFPLSLIPGGEVRCFIPAMEEIRLSTIAAGVVGAHLFRYTILRCRMTNLLRVRFGLVSQDEIPGDTWAKVKSGVL